MSSVLLLEETGVLEENLPCLVESNWLTSDNCTEPESNPSHSGERHVHYHCVTSTTKTGCNEGQPSIVDLIKDILRVILSGFVNEHFYWFV